MWHSPTVSIPLQLLADQLAKVRIDFLEQQELSERIHREIEAAKLALKPAR